MSEQIIITRHKVLRDALVARGVLEEGSVWLPYALEQDVIGKIVLGSVPLHLAERAHRVIDIPLILPPEKRRKGDISAEDVARYLRSEGRIFSVTTVGKMDLTNGKIDEF